MKRRKATSWGRALRNWFERATSLGYILSEINHVYRHDAIWSQPEAHCCDDTDRRHMRPDAAVDSTHVLSVSAHLTIREAIGTLNLMERFCSTPRLLVAEPGASLFAPVSDLDLRMALLGGCSPDCPLSQLPAQPGARPESARSLEQPGERFDLVRSRRGHGWRRWQAPAAITARMPKPMLPVQGRPVLGHTAPVAPGRRSSSGGRS